VGGYSSSLTIAGAEGRVMEHSEIGWIHSLLGQKLSRSLSKPLEKLRQDPGWFAGATLNGSKVKELEGPVKRKTL